LNAEENFVMSEWITTATIPNKDKAEVQSVLRRTTSNHRKIDAHASPTTPIKSAVPLRIMIEPTASGRKWIARLGERVLCVSASPFVKSARLLLAEGLPAAIVIEMWRPNTDESALQGRLGAVAATVIDGETASRCAKKGAPASDTEKSALHRAAGLRSSSGRSWRAAR
jgi:hypothetical protein